MVSRVFQESHYYLPFGLARLADAPALVENPAILESFNLNYIKRLIIQWYCM